MRRPFDAAGVSGAARVETWQILSRRSTEFMVGVHVVFAVMGATMSLTSGRCSVVPSERPHARPERRARRRTELATVENLETRDLMAFSSLGFSLPDLIVSGEAGARAAWNGSLTVTATLQNVGSSTTTEPISQAPGSASTADVPSSTISVLLTPHKKSLAGAIELGTLTAPALTQNSLEQVTGSLTLPSQPAGFHAKGGHYFIRLVANATDSVIEGNTINDVSKPIPVTVIGEALPELQAISLFVPPTMQPGDTIAPVIQVANLGTADTSTQGTLQVALVASTSPDFNLGSSIISLYTVSNIPAASDSPTSTTISNALESVTTADNVVTITGANVTLPTSPNGYYLGVVVDPYGNFNQLSLPSDLLEVIHVVGPAINGLPPAGVIGSASTYLFPNPVSGVAVGITSSDTTLS